MLRGKAARVGQLFKTKNSRHRGCNREDTRRRKDEVTKRQKSAKAPKAPQKTTTIRQIQEYKVGFIHGLHPLQIYQKRV